MTERILVGEVFANKAPNIAHDLQYVLIDGEYVEQVMLHLAYDLPEGWNVTPQNVKLIH